MSAAVMTVLTMSACTFTRTNYTCSDGRCELTLRGAGADTELFEDTILVRLDSADGSTAQLAVNEQPVTCAEGETVQGDGVSVTSD